MESNRDESYRCIDMTMRYIKKKDLDNAWKYSVKANKLYPTSKSKRELSMLKMFHLTNHLKKFFLCIIILSKPVNLAGSLDHFANK